MLDDSIKSLNAAIAAHSTLAHLITVAATDWAKQASGICPDLPDCDHDYDSEEIESHAMATTYYELAQDLLLRTGRGDKHCIHCDRPIPDPQLLHGESEYCLLHKDPG